MVTLLSWWFGTGNRLLLSKDRTVIFVVVYPATSFAIVLTVTVNSVLVFLSFVLCSQQSQDS